MQLSKKNWRLVWHLVDVTFLCTYSKYYQGGVISVPVGLLILVFWVSLMSLSWVGSQLSCLLPPLIQGDPLNLLKS